MSKIKMREIKALEGQELFSWQKDYMLNILKICLSDLKRLPARDVRLKNELALTMDVIQKKIQTIESLG